MSVPSPAGHSGALVASLLRLPLSLAHPVVLTFLVAAYFSYVAVRVAGLRLVPGPPMTSHVITIAGFVAFAAAGTGLNVLAHRAGSRIPTMGALFTRVMHSRTGRIAVVAWWAWLGLHLFSR